MSISGEPIRDNTREMAISSPLWARERGEYRCPDSWSVGMAGCHAAINVAKKGARVVVVDKGAVIRSGSGGGRDRPLARCLYKPML